MSLEMQGKSRACCLLPSAQLCLCSSSLVLLVLIDRVTLDHQSARRFRRKRAICELLILFMQYDLVTTRILSCECFGGLVQLHKMSACHPGVNVISPLKKTGRRRRRPRFAFRRLPSSDLPPRRHFAFMEDKTHNTKRICDENNIPNHCFHCSSNRDH